MTNTQADLNQFHKDYRAADLEAQALRRRGLDYTQAYADALQARQAADNAIADGLR
jgi:hypothetical protein